MIVTSMYYVRKYSCKYLGYDWGTHRPIYATKLIIDNRIIGIDNICGGTICCEGLGVQYAIYYWQLTIVLNVQQKVGTIGMLKIKTEKEATT